MLDRRALIEANLDLVDRMVSRLAARFPAHLDRRELWNAGALGLVDAACRYDPAMGTPFRPYAAIRIRGAIIDATRTRDLAPRSVRRRYRRLREVTDELSVHLGHVPTDRELADALGTSVEALQRIRHDAAATSPVQLDAGGDDSLRDTIPDPDGDPSTAVEERELIGALHLAIAHLPAPMREVVRRSFFGGELLREIAADLGVTEARVCQLRAEALVALRAYFADTFEGIPPVADDAPGRRARAAFVSALSARVSCRQRLEAASALSA